MADSLTVETFDVIQFI